MEQARPLIPAEQSAPEDRELVAAVLRKDRKATADFVARYADSVYSYVRRRVVPRTEVTDDLVQEVFLAAWQGLSHFRGDASLRQWLLGIARHKVEDYYRRRLRQAELPDEEDESIMELAVVPLFEEELDRKSKEEKVRRILALLPEAYSLALLWRYQEGRSVREMAQMAGKTEKAIERLLARARESFRRSWEHAEQSN
jgi:RNA polymerase sigma-70 factor (ECF subfamily)